jgi:hypothetical protein
MPGCLRTADSALRTGSGALIFAGIARSVRPRGLFPKHFYGAAATEDNTTLRGCCHDHPPRRDRPADRVAGGRATAAVVCFFGAVTAPPEK